MIRGAWMCRRDDDDDAVRKKICCAPERSDKPCADSERVQRWRMSLAALLFFTVLLSDQLWLCAGVKLRAKERSSSSHRKASSNGIASSNGSSTGEEECLNNGGGFLNSTLTKSTTVAAPGGVSSPCTDSRQSPPPQPLESACASLYWQKLASVGSPFFPSTQTVPPHVFLDYFGNFSLPFCDAFTVSDLLRAGGTARPDGLNCSLVHLIRDLFGGGAEDGDACSACVQAYVRLDQHAQEKYEEFELLFLTALAEEYSVRSRADDCKSVYKAWLCSEYFSASQSGCRQRIPCKQYCLEVQTRCPFLLPDNQQVVYAGLSSFICTGLLENHLTNGGPECCDVRWSGCGPGVVGSACALTRLTRGSSPWERRSQASSSACRLCLHGNSRLRLCVLALFLLHTVVSMTTLAHTHGAVGALDAMVTLEESSAREE